MIEKRFGSKIIVEGAIVNSDEEFYGQIEINTENGLIERVGNHFGIADIKVPKKQYIFPGFICVHSHLREDCSECNMYKEDFQTGTMAAVHGGVTLVGDMPNNKDAPVDDESYARKMERVLRRPTAAEIFLYAGIGPDTNPLSNKVPYKIYMGAKSDAKKKGPYVASLDFVDDMDVENAIGRYEGELISCHAESSHVLRLFEGEQYHEDQRPEQAEIKASELLVDFFMRYRSPVKMCHFSTGGGLDVMIDSVKKYDLDVQLEFTPHHLYFDRSMLNDGNRKMLQMNPPIRSVESRHRAIEYGRNGKDMLVSIATDHAPHTLEEKAKGMSGVPQLDTVGPFATWLIKKHNYSLQRVAEIFSENPGKFVNNFLSDKYGRVQEGFAGSLTVLDLDNPLLIRNEDMYTKCGWTPFDGMRMPGRVVYTIVRGKVWDHSALS